MLSEEEKKAIKLLKTYENKLVYEIEDKDKKAVKILLNLITKLQKENEELKTEKYICVPEIRKFAYRFIFPRLMKSMPIREYRIEEYKDYIKK